MIWIEITNNGFHMTQNAKKIVKIEAEYTPCPIEACQGNPLIEALPDYFSYTGSDIQDRLATAPEKPHPDATFRQRSEWLHQLSFKLFIPLIRHYELYSLVSTLIMQGYEKRRPVTDSYISMLQMAYHAQKQGSKDKVDYGGSVSADPMSVSLIGVSGVGKSYALDRLLGSLYPQVIHHNTPELGAVFDQVVYLKTEIPSNGSVKSMCASLISELGRVTGNNYAGTISKNITLERLRIQLESLFDTHCVGLIILDEVQNLLVSRSSKEELFNFIVEFSNTIHVPIVFVGTPKILEIRQQGMRVSRRLGSMGCLQWDRMQYGGRDWKIFIRELWRYNIMPSKECEIPSDIEQSLYSLSQGIPDLLIKLFILVQERTLACARSLADSGNPVRIYTETIQAVYDDYFTNVKPMIDILKSGDEEKIAEIEDLSLDEKTFKHAMETEKKKIDEMTDNDAYREPNSNEVLLELAVNYLRGLKITITAELKNVMSQYIAKNEEPTLGEVIKIALNHAIPDAEVTESARKNVKTTTEKSTEMKLNSSEIPDIDSIE